MSKAGMIFKQKMNWWGNRWLRWLLLATLLKGVVTWMVVPLWEFPDEQSHFAQVSHYVERGMKMSSEKNLSLEILEAEKVMGTVRDTNGINKYTYHPEYRPEYSSTREGIHERYLEALPREYRQMMVKAEAARYPPLFYLLSAAGYMIAYPMNIMIRVMAVRAVSLVMLLASVIVMYLIGKKLFQDEGLAVVLAGWLSFQPMFSFVSVGVNNDNLLNLISLGLIYWGLILFEKGMNQKTAWAIGILTGLGMLTKQLVLPMVIAMGIAVVVEWAWRRRNWLEQVRLMWPLMAGGLIFGGWTFLRSWIISGRIPYLPRPRTDIDATYYSPWEYFKDQLGRYYRETLVWYWGVFKWLGVILPLPVLRLIKVLMGVSGMGFVMGWRKLKDNQRSLSMFLVIVGVSFWTSITVWDYMMVINNGVTHGLQGRYFFPTIGAHLGLLLFGFLGWVGSRGRKTVGWIVMLGMILLNLVSLWVLLSNYYDTRNTWTLLMQMSQYKPEILKYPYSLFWWGGYLFSLVMFLQTLAAEWVGRRNGGSKQSSIVFKQKLDRKQLIS